MTKKPIVVGAVLLLVVVGGIFFLLGEQPKGPEEQSGSDTIPTQWSQAGDYEIKEMAGQQTVVINQKAGFSFRIPEGWNIKNENLGEEYSLNLLHPNAKFDEDNFLIEGCFISIETMYQPDEVIYITTAIKDLGNDPSISDSRKVIKLGERLALKTSLIFSINSDNPEVVKKVRDTVRVEISIHEQIVTAFELITKKNLKTDCLSFFDRFLSRVSFD